MMLGTLGRRALRGSVWLALAAGLAGSMAAGVACGSRDDGLFGGANPTTTSGTGGSGGMGGSLPKPAHADKIDLLFVVDNSPGTDLKHQILANDLPALLAVFTDPPCTGNDGAWQDAQGGACPQGTTRIFPPVADLHVGVITSSLGGHGADTCLADKSPSENDRGHLIKRASTDGTIPDVKTWNDKGFLVWDPNVSKPSHSPPGDSSPMSFTAAAKAIVVGAGQAGCGFEATHEAWYRFLADPNPYQSITIDTMTQTAVLNGTDDALLAQRAAFLRPDSLLVVMVLSDENDASIRDGSQYFFAAQRYAPGTSKPYHLPKPRAACAKDPNDPCCRSCGQQAGPGCSDAQDACLDAQGKTVPLAQEDDPINLRAWDNKRRFGIEFLYPTTRYAGALTEPTIADRNGNIVKNPIFSNLSGKPATVRDERLVLFTAIVGVPWQDLARTRQDGVPDLVTGRDAKGRLVGGFMTGAELVSNGRYGVILGDPAKYHTSVAALPTDALMIESVEARTGTSPIVKAALAPATAPLDANPINGHERTIATKSDLQYACIFQRPMPLDCGMVQCDCVPGDHDPLCQAPMTMTPDDAFQYGDKAYPGLRHIAIARELGERAALGSVCPARGANGSLGYTPMKRTLGDLTAPLLK
jgi:hypothetical protein